MRGKVWSLPLCEDIVPRLRAGPGMRITLITRISVKVTMILHMQARQLRREGQQSDIREPSRYGQYLDQFDATGVSGRLVPVRCRSRGNLILDLGSENYYINPFARTLRSP